MSLVETALLIKRGTAMENLPFFSLFYINFLLFPSASSERTSFSFPCSHLAPFLHNSASFKIFQPTVQGSPQIFLCFPSSLLLCVFCRHHCRALHEWRCGEGLLHTMATTANPSITYGRNLG